MAANFFNGLPALVISKISEQLDKPDLYAFLEASPKSEQILENSQVGLIVHDSLDGQIRSSPLNGIKSIDDCRIFTKIMKDMKSRMGSDLKHPSLAKMMILQGFASETNLSRLTKEPKNLQYLKINLETLDKISFVNHSLDFPFLKELLIYAPNLGVPIMSGSLQNVGLILVNIYLILGRANYPQLERLSLDIPFAHSHERSLTSSIVRVLVNHRTTLKKFLVNLQGNWSIPGPESLDLIESPPDVIGVNLSQFYVRCQNKSPETFLVFHNILSHQTTLKNIYFDTSDYPPLPMQLIIENASTLTSIEMDISVNEIGGFIDCTIFLACIGLKILSLISNPDVHKNAEDDDMKPEFLETNQLPSTLISLRLCYLNIHKSEIDKMAQSLKALKLLELQEVGEVNDLGMTIEALNVFKAETHVQRITVSHGFNRDSISTIRHDGLNWLADRVNLALKVSSCVTFYIKSGVYLVGKGSKDRAILFGEFIDLAVKEYKLQYPYGPFQLDTEEEGDDENNEVNDEEEENENEDEEEENENDEEEEGNGEDGDDENGADEDDEEDDDENFYDFSDADF